MTADEFFAGQALPKELFAAIRQEVEALGQVTICVTKSQIAFGRGATLPWCGCPAST